MDNMTIDQMIAAGAPWDQIKARINQLQAEQKEIARKAAAAEQLKKQEIEAARARMVQAVIDYFLAEGIINEKEVDFMSNIVEELTDELVVEVKSNLAKIHFINEIMKKI